MSQPGQGFIRGNLTSFIAIPFPIPSLAAQSLKEASVEVRKFRLLLEESPSDETIRQDYRSSMMELERIENVIRATVGEQMTRPEFLTMATLKR